MRNFVVLILALAAFAAATAGLAAADPAICDAVNATLTQTHSQAVIFASTTAAAVAGGAAAAALAVSTRVSLRPLLTQAFADVVTSSDGGGGGIALVDVIARLSNCGGIGAVAGAFPGHVYSTTYKFFTQVAAAARPDVAATWPPASLRPPADPTTLWDRLSVLVAPPARTATPWIVKMANVTALLTAPPPEGVGLPAATAVTGATIAALQAQMLRGFLVAVLYQSAHGFASCGTSTPVRRQIPWPTEQSRGTLALVVGVDAASVFLADPCGGAGAFVTVPRDEFMMRWHGCELEAGCVTGRAVYMATPIINATSTSDCVRASAVGAPASARFITTDPSSVPRLRSASRG